MKRYTQRALERNPELKHYQDVARAEFIRMMRSKVGSGNKKLSPEELEAARAIRKFAPANMDPEEAEKLLEASKQYAMKRFERLKKMGEE